MGESRHRSPAGPHRRRPPVMRGASAFVACAALLTALSGAAPAAPRAMAGGAPDEQVLIQETTDQVEAEARAAGGQPRVGIVADSIGVDPTGDIFRVVDRAFPVVLNRAILSSTIDDHRAATVRAVRKKGGPDALVVILGSAEAENNPTSAGFRSDMRRFLGQVLPHVDCVRWLDTQSGRANRFYGPFNRHHTRINRLIRSVAAEYGRVEDVHYSAWSGVAPPGSYSRDRLHPTATGRRGIGVLVRQAVAGCDEATNVAGFWDVKAGSWAAADIAWTVEQGLVTGYPNHTYRAWIGAVDIPVTRGQVASMLWHLAGAPDIPTPHPWTDGPAWLDPALRWVASTGAGSGYPDGTFRADRSMKRGELANSLWRGAGSTDVDPPHPWVDGSAWLDPALDWVAQVGLATGYGNGTFRPGRAITRAEIAGWLRAYAATTA